MKWDHRNKMTCSCELFFFVYILYKFCYGGCKLNIPDASQELKFMRYGSIRDEILVSFMNLG